MKLTAVLVEDEGVARKRLRDLLAPYDWIQIVGEAADGREAVKQIDALEPDLVFLDIELPEFDGLEVVKQIRHRPALIFTTAYDEYAISAFELAALDYLLKPFGKERLARAVERVKARFTEGGRSQDAEVAREALSAPRTLTRLLVRHAGKVIPLAVSEVERLEADSDYVSIHTKGRKYLVSLALGDFESRIDPQRFVRVHRSHIVNMDFVESLSPDENSQYRVQMRDGTVITASRSASKRLREQAL